jgi:DNA-binding protein HU-beta
MNKEQMIEIIAAEHGLAKKAAGEILRTVLGTIQNSVARGEKVTLVGFGQFEPIEMKPRKGFIPTTRIAIDIAERRRPKFTAGKAFRAAVQTGLPAHSDE